jgi:hypothetical protein
MDNGRELKSPSPQCDGSNEPCRRRAGPHSCNSGGADSCNANAVPCGKSGKSNDADGNVVGLQPTIGGSVQSQSRMVKQRIKGPLGSPRQQ